MRVAKPWFRKSTKTWHVTLDGKLVYLGKDEAKALEKFKRITQTGIAVDCTVRQVIVAYWKWAKSNLAESTCTRRNTSLESFSKSVRATLKACELRAYHVQRWIDSCPRVVSPTTVGDYITLIKGVMNWAKGMGYIDRNPIADMPKPSARVRQDFLPADTWARVLELATDDAFRDYLTVMLASGARPEPEFSKWAAPLTGHRSGERQTGLPP
jgi:hypothetical protein